MTNTRDVLGSSLALEIQSGVQPPHSTTWRAGGRIYFAGMEVAGYHSLVAVLSSSLTESINFVSRRPYST